MLGLNPGQLWLRHWLWDALTVTTRLDLIQSKLAGLFSILCLQLRVSRKARLLLSKQQSLAATIVLNICSEIWVTLNTLYIRPRLIQNRYVASGYVSKDRKVTHTGYDQPWQLSHFLHNRIESAAFTCSVLCSHGGRKLLISVLPGSFPGFYGRLWKENSAAEWGCSVFSKMY